MRRKCGAAFGRASNALGAWTNANTSTIFFSGGTISASSSVAETNVKTELRTQQVGCATDITLHSHRGTILRHYSNIRIVLKTLYWRGISLIKSKPGVLNRIRDETDEMVLETRRVNEIGC